MKFKIKGSLAKDLLEEVVDYLEEAVVLSRVVVLKVLDKVHLKVLEEVQLGPSVAANPIKTQHPLHNSTPEISESLRKTPPVSQ